MNSNSNVCADILGLLISLMIVFLTFIDLKYNTECSLRMCCSLLFVSCLLFCNINIFSSEVLPGLLSARRQLIQQYLRETESWPISAGAFGKGMNPAVQV